MPTQGIWAPRPRAQLLLALFLPFLTRGGGIALAMAKPLNLSQSSAMLSHSPAAAASRFPGCRRRFHWEALPRATPHREKWEGGSRGALSLRSPPRSKCQATSSCRDQPSQRAARFAAIPVAAASAGAAVASETVCTPRELHPPWPARAPGQVAAGLGQPGQLSPPTLSPGWPGAPSSPCMNVYFIRTDTDHGI